MPVVEDGSAISGGAQVVASSKAMVVTYPGHAQDGSHIGGGPDNGPAVFMENDPGEVTGARFVRSPEVDSDYRLRIAHDNILDRETFNYTAQNTGKHSHVFTTLTATASSAGILTNSANITTLNTGMTFGTFAEFPCGMGAAATYCETNASFSAAVVPANAVVDIGMFRRGVSTAFAPTDGAYFRFSPTGVFGVINRGGVESQVGPFTLSIVANQNYLLTISISEKRCRFWIDDVLMGVVENTGAGQPFISASLPWTIRHAIVGGAASGGYQATISDYTISIGGPVSPASLAQVGNRALGSYQGLSGGTMGTLANYANSANPASSAGSNTTANVTGLGGQGAINAAAAAATDFIMTSFQVPLGTTAVQGRRLVINGVKISCVNMGAAVATTATTLAFSLAFGHTAVSLATTETASFATATTKAPRRIPLGHAFFNVAAPIGAMPANGDVYMPFQNPIYVNPGEFIATTMKFLVGTATASQAIWYHVTFDYGWE